MLKMIDKNQPDYKILAVPANDPNFGHLKVFTDIPEHFLREVEHFFMTYKQLEGTQVESIGWVGTDEAKAAIERSITMYRTSFPPTGV